MPLVLYSDSLLSVFMEVKLSVEVMLLMFYYKFFLLGPHLEKMSVSFQVPLSYRTLINNLKCVPEDAKGTILFHPLKSTQCSPLHGTMLFGYVSVPGRTVVHFWGLFLFILLNTFCYVVVTQQLHTAALELLVFISNVIAEWLDDWNDYDDVDDKYNNDEVEYDEDDVHDDDDDDDDDDEYVDVHDDEDFDVDTVAGHKTNLFGPDHHVCKVWLTGFLLIFDKCL